MKAVSSAIVALAGAVAVAGGVSVPNHEVGGFAMFVGYGLIITGVLTWAITIFRDGQT